MTNMQIAVRLRRKPRVNPAAVLVLLEILDNYISNKMRRCSLCRYRYRPFTACLFRVSSTVIPRNY